MWALDWLKDLSLDPLSHRAFATDLQTISPIILTELRRGSEPQVVDAYVHSGAKAPISAPHGAQMNNL